MIRKKTVSDKDGNSVVLTQTGEYFGAIGKMTIGAEGITTELLTMDDLKDLTPDAEVKAIEDAKRVNKAVLIHVCTKKGIGYGPAEKNPSKFHGTPPFDIETGMPKKAGKKPSYTDTFSSAMLPC